MSLASEYLKVSNSLIERVYKSDLTAGQLRVLLAIMRKTYGWKTRENKRRANDRAFLGLVHLEEQTGMSRSTVRRSLKALVDHKVVLCHRPPSVSESGVYGINSDVEAWTIRLDGAPETKPRHPAYKAPKSSNGVFTDEHSPSVHERTPPVSTDEHTQCSPVTTSSVHARPHPVFTDEHSNRPQTVDTTGPADPLNTVLKKVLKTRSKDMSDGCSFVQIQEAKKAPFLELSMSDSIRQASGYLEQAFGQVLGMFDLEQLKLFFGQPVADFAPVAEPYHLGYKLGVFMVAIDEMVLERAAAKAEGKGRFVSSKPIPKAIAAAGERLSNNRLRARDKASQAPLGASESLENYYKRTGRKMQ